MIFLAPTTGAAALCAEMQQVNEDQVEKLYALLLERLEPLERAEVLQIIQAPEQALADVCTKYDILQDSDEKVHSVREAPGVPC
jgi:hypothetical protein